MQPTVFPKQEILVFASLDLVVRPFCTPCPFGLNVSSNIIINKQYYNHVKDCNCHRPKRSVSKIGFVGGLSIVKKGLNGVKFFVSQEWINII